MATPIQDKLSEIASAGIKKVVSDGEVVEMQPLSEIIKAAERESQQAAQAKPNFGIVMKRVRMGGSYPS